MKKRLLSTLLTLCMVLALLPVTALAAEASGTCGANMTWSYNNGTLTIQGTGIMDEGEYCAEEPGPWLNEGDIQMPWFDYQKQIHTIMIGEGVTNIAGNAFDGCNNLTNVTIPNSVTIIGGEAFRSCTSLTGVTIPDRVTAIGVGAFAGCTSLTGVDIPRGVTIIQPETFSGCRSLTGVTIPDSVTTIDFQAFFGCESLTNVTIPNSVTSIGGLAFQECAGLTSIVIPDSVSDLEPQLFTGCKSLTSVTIPASVTHIGIFAFSGCDRLTDVYYGGRESQWRQIEIEEQNEPLAAATIHYNAGGGTGSGGAAPAEPEQPAAPSGISVTVGVKAVEWTDAKPFIDANSRTMVPLRAVADAMGLDVNWDASTREASFTDGSKTIYFPIDSSSARTSGGGAVQMDTAAVIANERTYAPIRYLAEYFGYEVGWDTATQTVSLK